MDGLSIQLSDMIFATVGRIFHPAINPRLSKERMIIPSLRDLSSSRHSAKVEKQCREAAKLLAGHLYVWKKEAVSRKVYDQDLEY